MVSVGTNFVAAQLTKQIALQHDRPQRPPSGRIIDAERITSPPTVIFLGRHVAGMLGAVAEIRTSGVTAGPQRCKGHRIARTQSGHSNTQGLISFANSPFYSQLFGFQSQTVARCIAKVLLHAQIPFCGLD
jgi:hypothetical protein